MDFLSVTGALFAFKLGCFSASDYIISKALDIGTGKVWAEIKKHMEYPTGSIESQLYDAIEASIRNYADLYDGDQIAPACEMIYGAWTLAGHLPEEKVERALALLNTRYIGQRNIKLWYKLFYEEVVKRDSLYRWLMLYLQNDSINQMKRRCGELAEQIADILQKKEAGNIEHTDTEKEEYENELRAQLSGPVMGGNFGLQKIYVSLHGKVRRKNVLLADINREEPVIVDTTAYLWEWFKKDTDGLPLLFLHGDPGSGKSSLLKMAAATIASSSSMGGIVIVVELHRLTFSDTQSALVVVEDYLKEDCPWFFDRAQTGQRLLILDGLDEIRYKVYENARALVRELEGCSWQVPFKVIVSGRTQIIRETTESIRGTELEILPLFLDEYEAAKLEKEASDPGHMIQEDLRYVYWDALMEAFGTGQQMPVLNKRFDELSRSPLLLFLVAWTLKHGDIQFKELKNAAELYENIFRYVYTREYNRKSQAEIYYQSREYAEYQQMLHYLGFCAYRNNSRTVRVEDIYRFCGWVGCEGLCRRWIQLHKNENPSKLVLLFFLRERRHEIDWEESEIEFIHKTFYEYLAAMAIVEFIYNSGKFSEDADFSSLLFYLFAKNRLGDEILSFMKEILQNKCRMVDRKAVGMAEYQEHYADLFSWAFHRKYPVGGLRREGIAVQVWDYEEFAEKTEIYEDNWKLLTGMMAEDKDEETDSLTGDGSLELSCSEFMKARLPAWIFDGMLLEGCHFEDALISGASFRNCMMRGSIFINALGDRAVFCNADLSDADFSGARLATANFTDAVLTDTDFELAELEGAYFCNVVLTRTKFGCADLTAANFDGCVLSGADFHDADLTRADLSGIDIMEANWDNCIMEDARLNGVKLNQFDLDDPDMVEILAEADLGQADWEGVTEEQKRRLLAEEDTVSYSI